MRSEAVKLETAFLDSLLVDLKMRFAPRIVGLVEELNSESPGFLLVDLKMHLAPWIVGLVEKLDVEYLGFLLAQ